MRLDTGHKRHFGSWHDEVDFILLRKVDKLFKICDSNVDVFHLFFSIGTSITCSTLASAI